MVTVHPPNPPDVEDSGLTRAALNRVRMVAYLALECGVTRQDIDRVTGEAVEVYERMQQGRVSAPH